MPSSLRWALISTLGHNKCKAEGINIDQGPQQRLNTWNPWLSLILVSCSITDKVMKDYIVYRPYMVFFGLVNGLYTSVFKVSRINPYISAAAWQSQHVWSDFAVRMKKDWVLSYPYSTQRRLIRLGGCQGWSEFSLAHRSFCWFCHAVAHLFLVIHARLNHVCQPINSEAPCFGRHK